MSTEVVSLSRTSERAYRRGIVASKRSGHTEKHIKVCHANCMKKTKKAVIPNSTNSTNFCIRYFSREKMETFAAFAEFVFFIYSQLNTISKKFAEFT